MLTILVDHDVAQIKKLSKADMIEFFLRYISPDSPTRAKLSVHLLAKASAADRGREMSAEARTDKLLSLLSQYLSSEAIEGDTSRLRPRLAAIDVLKEGSEGLVRAVGGFLLEDLKAPKDKATAVMQKGQEMLGAVLPSLGISTPLPAGVEGESEGKEKAANGIVNGGTKGIIHKDAAMIEDVHAFKAGLAVSAGARPVKDLSEFEELEPKL